MLALFTQRGRWMKSYFALVTMMMLISSFTFAGSAPIEIKEFFLNSKNAQCAHAYLGECDNGYCYGDPESFFFGLRGDIPQNSQAHSFEDYVSGHERFKAQYEIISSDQFETLSMSLFRQAWAPSFPDRGGHNLGVAKFDYIIVKRVSDGQIIFAQEEEFIKRSLSGKWKANATVKTCRDEE